MFPYSSSSFREDLTSVPTHMATDKDLVPIRQPEWCFDVRFPQPARSAPASLSERSLFPIPLSTPATLASAQTHQATCCAKAFACAVPLPGTLICFPLAGSFHSGLSYKGHLLKEVFPGYPLKRVHPCSHLLLYPRLFLHGTY